MSRRKFKKDERRWLKKAGFSREHKEMGGLACALREAHRPTPVGYAQVQADTSWGERTRRRVRRERWNRQARVLRRMVKVTAIFSLVFGCAMLAVGLCWQIIVWMIE